MRIVAKLIKPAVYQYPYLRKVVYFALYDPQALVMIIDGHYKLLSVSNECIGSELKKAFTLNGKYYAMFMRCACQTDACGDRIY